MQIREKTPPMFAILYNGKQDNEYLADFYTEKSNGCVKLDFVDDKPILKISREYSGSSSKVITKETYVTCDIYGYFHVFSFDEFHEKFEIVEE